MIRRARISLITENLLCLRGISSFLGDNRNNSEDSRFADVDFVPLKLVKGEAVVAFWPVERWRMLP